MIKILIWPFFKYYFVFFQPWRQVLNYVTCKYEMWITYGVDPFVENAPTWLNRVVTTFLPKGCSYFEDWPLRGQIFPNDISALIIQLYLKLFQELLGNNVEFCSDLCTWSMKDVKNNGMGDALRGYSNINLVSRQLL